MLQFEGHTLLGKWQHVIPTDLDLNKVDHPVDRANYISKIETLFRDHETSHPLFHHASTLINKSMQIALTLIEEYEELAFKKLTVEIESLEDPTPDKSMNLGKKWIQYRGFLSARQLFFNEQISIANKTYHELIQSGVLLADTSINEGDELKEFIKVAMNTAFKIRKNQLRIKAKATPPEGIVITDPPPEYFERMVDYVIKKTRLYFYIEKWRFFFENISTVVEEYKIECQQKKSPWNFEATELFNKAEEKMAIAQSYLKENNLILAAEHYHQALRILTTVANYSLEMVECYHALADIYNKNTCYRDRDKAFYLYKLAIRTLEKNTTLSLDPRCTLSFKIKIKLSALYYETAMQQQLKLQDYQNELNEFKKRSPADQPFTEEDQKILKRLTLQVDHSRDLINYNKARSSKYRESVKAQCIKIYYADSIKLGDCYREMAAVYLTIHEVDFAVDFLEKAKKIYQYNSYPLGEHSLNVYFEKIKDDRTKKQDTSKMPPEEKYDPECANRFQAINKNHASFSSDENAAQESKTEMSKTTKSFFNPSSSLTIFAFIGQTYKSPPTTEITSSISPPSPS